MTSRLCTLIVSVALLVAGCSDSGDDDSSNPARDDASSASNIDAVEFTLTYIESDSLEFTDTVPAPGNRLIFEFIPGHVYANILMMGIGVYTCGQVNMADVDFSDDIFTELTRPEILSIEGLNDGLMVEPIDAQFGRLGTFVADSSGESVPTNGGYGLYDGRSGLAFVLLYFDRAAKLTGSRSSSSGAAVFDIEVPREGFYAAGLTELPSDDGLTTFMYDRVLDLQNEAFFYIRE